MTRGKQLAKHMIALCKAYVHHPAPKQGTAMWGPWVVQRSCGLSGSFRLLHPVASLRVLANAVTGDLQKGRGSNVSRLTSHHPHKRASLTSFQHQPAASGTLANTSYS